jgi:hypothetical protein
MGPCNEIRSLQIGGSSFSLSVLQAAEDEGVAQAPAPDRECREANAQLTCTESGAAVSPYGCANSAQGDDIT